MGPSLHLWFLHAKSDFWIRTTSLYGSQTSPVDLRMQNIVLRSRMTLVYWSQRSSGVLCIQNSDFRTSITSLYGSQTSPMFFFTFKRANLAPKLQVSLGSSPHLWFCAFRTATLWPELIVSMGPRPQLSFWACKTMWLAPELLVTIGPRPHLSLCACKTTCLAL